MRRRAQRANHRRLHPAGDGARPGRQPARRRRSRARRWRRFRYALGASSSLLAQAQYGVTWSAAVQGIGIGVLVSLLFSVVPLLQVRFVKPSLLLRDEAVARRLGLAGHRRARRRGGRAGRAHGLAGGVAAGRPDRLRRVCRPGRSCCSWRAARSSRWSRRSRTRGRFRCATPCCISRGPAIRRASSCWPSGSARSSSSASGRCRRACSRSSRCRSPTNRRTCS